MASNDEVSPLDFSRRRPEDQSNAVQRVYAEAFAFERSSPAGIGDESPFIIDSDRIKNSHYHLRLKGITQFHLGNSEGVQTRSSHTGHVEQVARKIARALKLGEQSTDLAMAIASAHDIGHPPFAHDGEHALDAKMKALGGSWDHDVMGLRILTELANSGISFPGTNPTVAVIEGLAKRYWRFTDDSEVQGNNPHFFRDMKHFPREARKINRLHDLHLKQHNHIEGQIASVSDWIAFTATDMEDGLRTGVYTMKELCDHCPIAKEVYDDVHKQIFANYHGDEKDEFSLKQAGDNRVDALITIFRNALETRLIDDTVSRARDVVATARGQGRLNYADDVRDLDDLVMSFSPKTFAALKEFDAYCGEVAWPRVQERFAASPQAWVEQLFDDFYENKGGIVKGNTGWVKEYDRLKSLPPTEENRLALGQLICEYITIFFTDQRVTAYIAKYHKDMMPNHEGRKGTSHRITRAPYPKGEVVGRHTSMVSEGEAAQDIGRHT